jgi:phosphopantetheine--protein transferase-like protein
MNFRGIIKSFFSKSESEFILEEPDKASDRFFKLWTRKEAFLKALGTGIADNLQGVEVSGNENHIRKESFENLVPVSVLREHYIYSFEYLHYVLSIAVPYDSEIIFHHLSGSSIFSIFNKRIL